MFDVLRDVRVALAEVVGGFDPGVMSPGDASRCLREAGRIRRLSDGLFMLLAARTADGVVGGAQVEGRNIAAVARVDKSDACRALATGKRLADLPATAAAVKAGDLTGRQAELISGAAAVNPDAEATLLALVGLGDKALADACVRARAEGENEAGRTARLHSQRSLRWWTDPEGMLAGRFRLTPEAGGVFKAAVEDEARRVFREHRAGQRYEPLETYAADALYRLISGAGAGAGAGGRAASDGKSIERTASNRDVLAASGVAPPGSGRVRVNVHILIDHDVLTRGATHPGETCEIPGVGPVDAQWVRSVLGDAFVTAIIRKGEAITTIGHLGRHIPAALRTALLVSGRECFIDGCENRGYLEVHHNEIGYAAGGATSLWNLKHACSPDHTRLTKGWKLGPLNPTTGKYPLHPP